MILNKNLKYFRLHYGMFVKCVNSFRDKHFSKIEFNNTYYNLTFSQLSKLSLFVYFHNYPILRYTRNVKIENYVYATICSF